MKLMDGMPPEVLPEGTLPVHRICPHGYLLIPHYKAANKQNIVVQ
jgi:hypothetical protein